MISTRNLGLLPDVRRLKAAFQSMAVLDAIIEPDWGLRYYSFAADLSPDGRISIGEMRNGSGDDLLAIFSPTGCLVRGFAHESAMSPYANDPPQVFRGVISEIPADFSDCVASAEHGWWENVTFCIWRRHSDSSWHRGTIEFPADRDPDGSEDLLSAYDGQPETYHLWAETYYHPQKFSLEAVKEVFAHLPLAEKIIQGLNPERSLDELASEIQQIGYPRGNS